MSFTRRHPFLTLIGLLGVLLLVCGMLVARWLSYGPIGHRGDCREAPLALNPATGRNELNISHCAGRSDFWIYAANYFDHRAAFYPEPAAVYWSAHLPEIVGKSGHWEIRGLMPDARFFSFQSYNETGGFIDVVPDNELRADAGHVNWIHRNIPYPESDPVPYTLKIVQVDSPDNIPKTQDGVLYVTRDAGEDYTLLMRIYANYDVNGSVFPETLSKREWINLRGQVDLPEAFYVEDDAQKSEFQSVTDVYNQREYYFTLMDEALVKYSQSGKEAIEAAGPDTSSQLNGNAASPTEWTMNASIAAMAKAKFEGLDSTLSTRFALALIDKLPASSAFSNDANNYFVGSLNPRFGDVHLTRFKYMTSPSPYGGAIDSNKQDIRFWSFCMHTEEYMYTTECIEGNDATPDADGFVTFVVSNTDSAPLDPVTGVPAKNWMPYAELSPLILIRHLLPSEDNPRSLYWYGLRCKKTSSSCDEAAFNTEALREFTGDYYPMSRYCSIEEYQTNRCGLLTTESQ